jgi:hypothetical protein
MTRAKTACENCRYFYNKYPRGSETKKYVSYNVTETVAREVASGECRINAPAAAQSEGGGGWPWTTGADWCAQFISFDGDGFDNPDRPDTF